MIKPTDTSLPGRSSHVGLVSRAYFAGQSYRNTLTIGPPKRLQASSNSATENRPAANRGLSVLEQFHHLRLTKRLHARNQAFYHSHFPSVFLTSKHVCPRGRCWGSACSDCICAKETRLAYPTPRSPAGKEADGCTYVQGGKRVRSSRPMQARHCGRPSPHTPAGRGRSGGEAEPENPPAGKMQKATRHLLRTTPKKKNPGYSPGSRFRKPPYMPGKFSLTDCYSSGFFSALTGMRQMTPSANSQQYR